MDKEAAHWRFRWHPAIVWRGISDVATDHIRRWYPIERRPAAAVRGSALERGARATVCNLYRSIQLERTR